MVLRPPTFLECGQKAQPRYASSHNSRYTPPTAHRRVLFIRPNRRGPQLLSLPISSPSALEIGPTSAAASSSRSWTASYEAAAGRRTPSSCAAFGPSIPTEASPTPRRRRPDPTSAPASSPPSSRSPLRRESPPLLLPSTLLHCRPLQPLRRLPMLGLGSWVGTWAWSKPAPCSLKASPLDQSSPQRTWLPRSCFELSFPDLLSLLEKFFLLRLIWLRLGSLIA